MKIEKINFDSYLAQEGFSLHEWKDGLKTAVGAAGLLRAVWESSGSGFSYHIETNGARRLYGKDQIDKDCYIQPATITIWSSEGDHTPGPYWAQVDVHIVGSKFYANMDREVNGIVIAGSDRNQKDEIPSPKATEFIGYSVAKCVVSMARQIFATDHTMAILGLGSRREDTPRTWEEVSSLWEERAIEARGRRIDAELAAFHRSLNPDEMPSYQEWYPEGDVVLATDAEIRMLKAAAYDHGKTLRETTVAYGKFVFTALSVEIVDGCVVPVIPIRCEGPNPNWQ